MEKSLIIKTESANDFFASGELCAVPFLMSEEDDRLEIEIYDDLADTLLPLLESDDFSPFSRRFLDRLDDVITPYLASHGYERDRYGIYRWYHSFRADKTRPASCAHVLSSTVLLTKPAPSALTMDGEVLAKRSAPAFVTLEGGKIVSCATVNDFDEGASVLEITVETAPSYRGKGFGRSNVEALAAYLIKRGYSTAYCCSRYNRASIALAKSAGFTTIGRFYAVAGYKIID